MDENDLPLLSNIESVRARHYLLRLIPDVANQVIYGTVIIFFDSPSICESKGEFCTGKCICTSTTSLLTGQSTFFPVTLECNDINIRSVFEVKPRARRSIQEYLFSQMVRKDAEDFAFWNDNTKVPLSYSQDKWSLNIEKPDKPDNQFQAEDFPKVISINYVTRSEGDSIYWRKCENGEICFFTTGSFINNRSLIPAQDRPFAMATWQAWIIVPEGFYVSMTGDDEPIISNYNSTSVDLEGISTVTNTNCFYYYTSMLLPLATIAIAVGKWKKDVILSKEIVDNYNATNTSSSTTEKSFCNHVNYPCHMTRDTSSIGPLIPVTVVTSKPHLVNAVLVLKFVKYILLASFKLLGIHPFRRLEIAILPRCFPHLGLASPNLLFLSKSVVLDDSSFYLRLAHEISHSWFGITIGPKNWEEEWLSEGVATYLEDSIFVLAQEESLEEESRERMQVADVVRKYSDFFALRGHLRYKMLLSERENSDDDDLQVLCPDSMAPSVGKGKVNNGLNAEKSFLQVHYLKGYFLLHHLSSMVSRPAFDAYMGRVAATCHGQLISSLQFLRLFYDHFRDLSLGDDPALRIFNAWLKNSDINSEIVDSFSSLTDNRLMKDVSEHYRCWINYDESLRSQTPLGLNTLVISLLAKHKFFYSDQIVLLFEDLLQVKNLRAETLKAVHTFYNIKCRNPEIQHRWCELIIKFKYPDLTDVSEFLIENQSMGVYLYGELMISQNKKQAKVAKDTFLLLKDELSSNSKTVISSMVFGE